MQNSNQHRQQSSQQNADINNNHDHDQHQNQNTDIQIQQQQQQQQIQFSDVIKSLHVLQLQSEALTQDRNNATNLKNQFEERFHASEAQRTNLEISMDARLNEISSLKQLMDENMKECQRLLSENDILVEKNKELIVRLEFRKQYQENLNSNEALFLRNNYGKRIRLNSNMNNSNSNNNSINMDSDSVNYSNSNNANSNNNNNNDDENENKNEVEVGVGNMNNNNNNNNELNIRLSVSPNERQHKNNISRKHRKNKKAKERFFSQLGMTKSVSENENDEEFLNDHFLT